MKDNYTHLDPLELLTYDADVLVPSALEDQLGIEAVPQIRAEYIVELANGPTTAEADMELEKRGVTVLPDILANAGGVVVSYFEWLQNVSLERWSANQVNLQLAETMSRAFEAVFEIKNRKGISFRLASYCLAMDRVATAIRQEAPVQPKHFVHA